jgi:hypothetical protein
MFGVGKDVILPDHLPVATITRRSLWLLRLRRTEGSKKELNLRAKWETWNLGDEGSNIKDLKVRFRFRRGLQTQGLLHTFAYAIFLCTYSVMRLPDIHPHVHAQILYTTFSGTERSHSLKVFGSWAEPILIEACSFSYSFSGMATQGTR